MQEVTHKAVTSNALKPKIIVLAIIFGTSAIITCSIINLVDKKDDLCGDGDTIKPFKITSPFYFFFISSPFAS